MTASRPVRASLADIIEMEDGAIYVERSAVSPAGAVYKITDPSFLRFAPAGRDPIPDDDPEKVEGYDTRVVILMSDGSIWTEVEDSWPIHYKREEL